MKRRVYIGCSPKRVGNGGSLARSLYWRTSRSR